MNNSRNPRSLFTLILLAATTTAIGTAKDARAAASLETPAAAELDADGVQMILPSAQGTSFRLGTNDPNKLDGFAIENKQPAKQHPFGASTYWNTNAYKLDYSDGNVGKTARLHIMGGDQKFSWRTEKGFLSSASELKNQEVTVYVRVHDIFDPERAMVTLKIRGGDHTTANGDLASCTMMTIGALVKNTMFGKELTHPSYDYVKLAPQTQALLKDNQWIGLKIVSYAQAADPTKIVNQLYVDTSPFDADAKPLNNWELLSEYNDTEGKSTGRYSKLADWSGKQTTVRFDGLSSIDFRLLSAREITPPN